MEKKVTLTIKEMKRMHVIDEINAGRLTAKTAGEILGLSVRQVRRLVKKQREQGDEGLTHGNRGRVSPRRLEASVREQIIALARGKYRDYNDCHFQEELAEMEDPILVSRSTVRTIRREAGVSSPRKRRAPRHRSRRERKPQAGMMLQTDGSRHDWLEGRGPWLSLLAYIDDATSEVLWAGFREEEDAAGYFLGLRAICLTHGIPGAIYADRHTIFHSPGEASKEQILAGEQPRSQFGRLLDELQIELIEAGSAQAKGRVERLWLTFQDRLVKALREAQACNAEEANQVLIDFLPKFNTRFAVTPAQPGSVFLPWPQEYHTEDHFCFKYIRTVTNDNTIRFAGNSLQIPPGSKRRSYAKAKVDLYHQLDGQLQIRYQDQVLITFAPQTHAPLRINQFQPAPDQQGVNALPKSHKALPQPKASVPYKPPADHPWRRYGETLKGKRIG